MPCFFFSHTSKNRSNLIKKKQSKIFWEGNSTKFPSSLRHIIVYILLVYKRVNMVTQQNTMVSGFRRRTLSFPISAGFKRTPYDTKSYSKPPSPGQTVFVCVGLTISALNMALEDFQLGGRRAAQATASEASRPSACARYSRGSKGLAPWRGLQEDSTPLPMKIWYFAS